MMTCFSEKMLVSYSCIPGFMPNLHKKSWMVSNTYRLPQLRFENHKTITHPVIVQWWIQWPRRPRPETMPPRAERKTQRKQSVDLSYCLEQLPVQVKCKWLGTCSRSGNLKGKFWCLQFSKKNSQQKYFPKFYPSLQKKNRDTHQGLFNLIEHLYFLDLTNF